MEKKSKYWQERFDQIEQAANNKSVRYASKLEKKYQQAASEIDAQINKWYNRIAINNQVSMSEARRLLTASELKEFKWTVEEYIEYGRKNAIDQQWMKELENASAKFHINRLEAMKLECRHQIEVAMANGQQDMFDTLSSVYKDTFYRSYYELQKGVGIGFDVSKLDDNMVSRLLNKPWAADGTNFSQKLWGNKTKLINKLDEELSRMVLTGETPKRAIHNIKEAMNSSLFQAKRLVFTEQAYFTSEAQKKTFNELDVERFEVLSSMDMKVCPICAANDKKVHPMIEFHVGITAPPFHPLCRCVTAPFFDDEFATGTRIARGADGETYYIPNTMTYKEWESTFLGGGNKNGLTKVVVTKSTKNNADAPFGLKDVTKQWVGNASGEPKVTDVLEFEQDGVVYAVDGKHVVLDYKANEKHVAETLSKELGREVLMMPKVQFPQNIQTPDYIIDGRRFDLKSPIGKGKEVLLNMVKGKAKQANNFVFDITNCPLSVDELTEQAKKLFTSRHSKFVDSVMLVKNDKVISVFERKK